MLALALPGCEKAGDLSESESALVQQHQVGSSPIDDGDRPAPQAITAIWSNTGAPGARSITARIQNVTSDKKLVEVTLVGLDPQGREVSRKLGRRTVNPRSALEMPVAVRDLPVQSAGHASPISIAVTYDIDAMMPDGKSTRMSHVTHSAATYVTFADDFATATARSAADEAQNGTGRRGDNRAMKVRHYNSASDRIDEQPQASGDGTPILLGVTDLAPGPLPSHEAEQ